MTVIGLHVIEQMERLELELNTHRPPMKNAMYVSGVIYSHMHALNNALMWHWQACSQLTAYLLHNAAKKKINEERNT